jgi:hypothetical protein
MELLLECTRRRPLCCLHQFRYTVLAYAPVSGTQPHPGHAVLVSKLRPVPVSVPQIGFRFNSQSTPWSLDTIVFDFATCFFTCQQGQTIPVWYRYMRVIERRTADLALLSLHHGAAFISTSHDAVALLVTFSCLVFCRGCSCTLLSTCGDTVVVVSCTGYRYR